MLGLRIGRVCGTSMLPRIAPDSFVIACRLPVCYPKKAGQVFYLHHPQYGLIVKTLSRVDKNGRYWFRGESPESVSENDLGALEEKHIIGRVIKVIHP